MSVNVMVNCNQYELYSVRRSTKKDLPKKANVLGGLWQLMDLGGASPSTPERKRELIENWNRLYELKQETPELERHILECDAIIMV